MITQNDDSTIKEEFIRLSEKGDIEGLKTQLQKTKPADHTLYGVMKAILQTQTNKKAMDALEIILRQMKNINYHDSTDNNCTPLMAICQAGHLQALNFIMSNFEKLDFNCIDNKGENPLHKLIDSANDIDLKLQILKILLGKRINFDKQNIDGYTPLALALIFGDSNIAAELIKKGANTNHIVHSNGDSLLHCSVIGKNPKCLTLLLDLDVEYKNRANKTAADLADKPELKKLKEMLQSRVDNSKATSMMNIFNDFKNKNFSEVSRVLGEYIKYNDNDVSAEWNFLLSEYSSEVEINQPISQTKFINKFFAFFESISGNNNNHRYSTANTEMNQGFLYSKLGRYKNAFRHFNNTLHKATKIEDSMPYINIACNLVSSLLDLRQLKGASEVLSNLENFLQTVQQPVKTPQKQKDGINDYLTSRELLSGSSPEEIISVINLFKAYKFILEDKIDEANKHMKEYKRVSLNSKLKDAELSSIFFRLKNFYRYLKIKIDYNNNAFSKFYKHLNSLYTNSILNNEKTLGQSEPTLFYLNSIGIINLKQKKYQLAEFFFKNCLTKLLQYRSSADLKFKGSFIYIIKYNIGLSLFYQKLYEKAYEYFKIVANYITHSPFVHFRLGLCALEVELVRRKGKSQKKYNETLAEEIGFKDRYNIDINMPFNAVVTDDNYVVPKENFNEIQTQKTTPRRVILRNQNCAKKEISDLNEAIKAFKQTILILRGCSDYKSEMNELLRHFDDNNENRNGNSPNQLIETKSYNSVLISTYFNLLFSLLLKEEWNEVLSISNQVVTLGIYNKDTAFAFDNYRMEAYMALNQRDQVLEILKRNMRNNSISYSSLDFKGHFYNRTNGLVYPEIHYKLALYINIIKMNFNNNNLQEAENGILSILNMVNININTTNSTTLQGDWPPYIMNLLIYYYMARENYEAALNLIKWRKMPNMFANTVIAPTNGTTMNKQTVK